jgi:hypothetical protein
VPTAAFGGGVADLRAGEDVAVDPRCGIALTESRDGLGDHEVGQQQLADGGIAAGQPAQHVDRRRGGQTGAAMFGGNGDAEQSGVGDPAELGDQRNAVALAFGAADCQFRGDRVGGGQRVRRGVEQRCRGSDVEGHGAGRYGSP